MKLKRVTDESDLVAWHGVWSAALAHDFDALPADPVEDLRPALDGPVAGDDTRMWLGVVDGTVVAAIQIRLPLHDNLDLALPSLHLHPDHRGLGYGRAAAEAGLALVRELGRSRVLCEVPSKTRHQDPSFGEALGRALGARPLQVETRRVLDLRSLPADALDQLHDEAAERSRGYSTVTWLDHTPSEYVEDMAALMALMSTDPPQGELTLEPEVWDAARYLDHEESVLARRRIHLTAAARDDRTGRLVGFTDVGVPSGGAEVGYQWSTVVDGVHRGHRLGLLLKVANLRQVLEQTPYVRYLNTWNADVNRHMVSVNEKLGFTPKESWSEYGLDL